MTRRRTMREGLRVAASLGLAVTVGVSLADESTLDSRAPPAQFADPGRTMRFAAAYSEIDRVMREFVARERVPGAAWGIIVDGRVAHLGVTGLRDVESGEAVGEDTVFRIASMTKSFTAMAILQLRDAGRLSLDDPVERYIPSVAAWRYPTSDSPKITIRHLLTHSAGLPEDNPWGDQQLAMTDREFDEFLQRGATLSNAPGIAYEYSNTGYALLGRIVAEVSGMPFPRYLQERILTPLGMQATTLDPDAVSPARRTQGYRLEDDAWRREPQLPDGAFGAMGGLLTSIGDLARYVAVFLDAYPPRDDAQSGPLSRASLREMQQVSRSRPATVTRGTDPDSIRLNALAYGYGLRLSQTCEFGQVVGHTGGLPGFGSQMRWLPEYGVGLVAFGNRTYTGWGSVFDEALDLLRRTGGLQPRVPAPSPALTHARREVNALIREWSDDRAAALAAMNLFLDRSLERRREEVALLRNSLGECREREDFFTIENPLRGEWILDCQRGLALASVTLAPTTPVRVQHLEIRAVETTDLILPSTCPVTDRVP